MGDKRVYARKTIRGSGSIADASGESWVPVTILDISQGGVGFHGRSNLIVGHVRMIRFTLPTDPPLEATATVRIAYCAPHPHLGGFRVGAEFKKLDSEKLEAIIHLVDHH
ncbi:PilZ domain-containing protein [Chitinivorax sp. B]|uniref:PilZ domain-containing protein n=1 Tax=Chitinivorax sp. B TaxID=2502235 RepID=UPI0010FA44B5|nr:PilZ domain-containing protein [Chitinivorax sp. B]